MHIAPWTNASISSLVFFLTLLPGFYSVCHSAEPIVLGVPTSLGFLEGKEGLACVNLAIDEINAAGGVNVGGTMRPFKVVAIDARGAEPGAALCAIR